ncbi:DsbA family protein [Catalinimonas niigatensis]|uniref:DsbA family protein n=1 Tax=Catalinimonas niigatensis TaxID=1397264 RepID=UPI002665B53A|nr:DsbA family protein [Catalinimonas niigatensis]WPP53212.1 DsbA family protein [Catalinimonas niigatensis]
MENNEILYCYDPLCGWCYGFSPVIEKLEKHFKEQLKFTAYSGGMVTGSRVAPIGETFSYIKGALQTVEERAGVAFGQGFKDLLEEGSYIYNSEPPCRALSIFKSVSNGSSIAFAHDLQKAIFYDGQNLNDVEVLAGIAERHHLDKEFFIQLFADEKYQQKTWEEFAFVQRLSVTGFPTLLFRNGRKLYVLSRGYQAYEPLKETISQVVKEYSA